MQDGNKMTPRSLAGHSRLCPYKTIHVCEISQMGEASLAHKQRQQAAALHIPRGEWRSQAMEGIAANIHALYDISCL